HHLDKDIFHSCFDDTYIYEYTFYYMFSINNKNLVIFRFPPEGEAHIIFGVKDYPNYKDWVTIVGYDRSQFYDLLKEVIIKLEDHFKVQEDKSLVLEKSVRNETVKEVKEASQ